MCEGGIHQCCIGVVFFYTIEDFTSSDASRLWIFEDVFLWISFGSTYHAKPSYLDKYFPSINMSRPVQHCIGPNNDLGKQRSSHCLIPTKNDHLTSSTIVTPVR